MMIYLLNKKYEDEMTKCYILSAIMKIHSGINYIELESVNEAIKKYSKIKNPEIQQRCIEYKRNKEKNIAQKFNRLNINDKLTNNEIDFDLKFLNDFCNSNKNKKYNSELSDYYFEKFSNTDKKMNIGPYQDSSNILSMPGSSSQINKLYESNTQFTRTDMKNELNVKAEKKWGEEGYIKDDKDNDKKWEIETIKIESIESNNYGKNEKNDYNNNNNNNKKSSKKVEEVDPNEKKLMLDLFGGLNGDAKPEKKNNKKNIKNEQPQNQNPVKNNTIGNNNNLFYGLTQNYTNNNANYNTNNNINNNQLNNNTNTNNFNLFEGMTQNVSNNIPNNNTIQKNINIPNSSNMLNNYNTPFNPYIPQFLLY